jgi:hypothetical protein
MGKNNKKGSKVPPAPEVKAEEKVVEPEVINNKKKVNVIDADGLVDQLNNPRPGLDANHQVDLLNGLDRHFMQPNAADKLGISQETVDKVNVFTAHGWVVVAAQEGMFGTSAFAGAIRQSMLPTIIDAAHDMGITIDQKALPAPSEDGTIQVPSIAIKPSKEAKEQLKKEHEILEKKPNIDPTKIESDAELKDAINFIMADAKNGWEKIKNAIQFYRSYLSAKANKSDKKEEELAALNKKSNLELLDEIKNVIHDCPIVLSGIGRSMGTFTGSTKSPIVAFCMLKSSATDRKTGECELSDSEVADYTRAIVTWVNELSIENYNARIAEHEKNLAILKKDAKKNAEGIKDVEGKIESCKNSIAHCKDIIDMLTNASTDTVDSLIIDYADAKSSNNRAARLVFQKVFETYYSDVDLEKNDIATVKHNVQQRAGIIVNLFRDPTTPNLEYNEANLTEMVLVAKEGEEEKKE